MCQSERVGITYIYPLALGLSPRRMPSPAPILMLSLSKHEHPSPPPLLMLSLSKHEPVEA